MKTTTQKKRIDSLDILRGIAVLQMIFWQIFDFFSRTNIYEYSSPYFIRAFNMPINGIGLALFGFVSGASLYISIKNRLEKNLKKLEIIKHAIIRYGSYILLSLFFTTFVFGFATFYEWGEAIQGIGLAALITALLLLFFRSKWFYAVLGLLAMFSQPIIRKAVEIPYILQHFPLEPVSFNLFSNIVSVIINSTIRGFFALTHVLPLLLIGVFGSMLISELSEKKKIRTFSLTGSIIVMLSLIMHFTIMKIDIYNRSPAYMLFFIGISILLLGLIEYFLLFGKNTITNFLSLFGKTAIVAYLFHFVVILKTLQLLNLESTFNYTISYIFTFISIAIIYYACKLWIVKNRQSDKLVT